MKVRKLYLQAVHHKCHIKSGNNLPQSWPQIVKLNSNRLPGQQWSIFTPFTSFFAFNGCTSCYCSCSSDHRRSTLEVICWGLPIKRIMPVRKWFLAESIATMFTGLKLKYISLFSFQVKLRIHGPLTPGFRWVTVSCLYRDWTKFIIPQVLLGLTFNETAKL